MPLPPEAETDPSYYDVLGIPHNFFEVHSNPPAALKKKYYIAALKCHPDKEGGNQEEFQLLNRAYHVLGNSKLHLEYDDCLKKRASISIWDLVSESSAEAESRHRFYSERQAAHRANKNLTSEVFEQLNEQLVQAIHKWEEDKIKHLLQEGAFPCTEVEYGESSKGPIICKLIFDISHCKHNNQKKALENILEACANAVADPIDFNIMTNLQDTPLTLAIRLNEITQLKLLLEKGADPVMGNSLHVAVGKNNLEIIDILMADNRMQAHPVMENALGETPLRRAIYERFSALECGSFIGVNKEVSPDSLRKSKDILDSLFHAYMKTFEEKCVASNLPYDLTVVMREIKSEFGRLNTLPIPNNPKASEKLDHLYTFEFILRNALTLVSSDDEAEKAWAIQEIKEFIANQSKYPYRMVGVLCMLIGVALFVAGIPLPAILTFKYVMGASSATAIGASLFYYGQDTKLVKALSAWMQVESLNNKPATAAMNAAGAREYK
jgi:hypothetical protein